MGLSSITGKQREAAWRVEFQALGEQLVFKNVKQDAIYNNEAKRQAALRWLSERARLAQLAWGRFCGDWRGAYQHHWLISGSPLSCPRRFPPQREAERIGATSDGDTRGDNLTGPDDAIFFRRPTRHRARRSI